MENLNKIFFQFVFHTEREISNYSDLDHHGPFTVHSLTLGSAQYPYQAGTQPTVIGSQAPHL